MLFSFGPQQKKSGVTINVDFGTFGDFCIASRLCCSRTRTETQKWDFGTGWHKD
jgi:hypothetical protein